VTALSLRRHIFQSADHQLNVEGIQNDGSAKTGKNVPRKGREMRNPARRALVFINEDQRNLAKDGIAHRLYSPGGSSNVPLHVCLGI